MGGEIFETVEQAKGTVFLSGILEYVPALVRICVGALPKTHVTLSWKSK